MNDNYARFLLEEMLPEVGKSYSLTKDPEGRAIGGTSSGAICAFTVAWQRPDEFRNVRGGGRIEVSENDDHFARRIDRELRVHSGTAAGYHCESGIRQEPGGFLGEPVGGRIARHPRAAENRNRRADAREALGRLDEL